MNAIYFYVLGIALGFASGMLVMIVRGRPAIDKAVTSSPTIEPEPIHRPPASLTNKAEDTHKGKLALSETTESTIPADLWLQDLEFNLDQEIERSEKFNVPKQDESDQEVMHRPDAPPSSYSEDANWMDTLKKTHEVINNSNQNSLSSLPLIFDSSETQGIRK